MPTIQEQIEQLRKRLESILHVQDLIPNATEQIEALKKELAEKEASLIQTEGGAFVAGDVNTNGGDFVGRDKIENVLNARVVNFQKDANGNIVMIGDNNRVIVSANEAPALMLRRYTIALARECQKLPLGLLGEQFAVPGAEQKITLKNVYTDLDVTAPPRPEDEDDEHQMRLWGLRLSQGEGQRTPLLQAIGEPSARKLIILGEAGSGKTTFVNFIASALAGASETEEIPAALRGLIPIRVILRQAARQLEPGQEHAKAGLLWQAVHVEMSDILGKATADQVLPYLQQQVEQRGALVLLDGLDEVPEANQRRQCLLESIQAWAETLPEQTRFLLTARPYAYVGLFRLPEFQELALAPFSQEQATSFIHQWYQAVRSTQIVDEDKAKEKTQELIEAMQERPQLADLASRPLLLTLMATLHTHRGKLPENRADLYEGSVGLLLERWQEQRQVKDMLEPSIERVLGLGTALLRRAMETLAYETHQRQGQETKERDDEQAWQAADIPATHIIEVLMRYIPEGKDVRDPLKYLEERAGLLIARREGTYAFLHRSFQEYLAACYLSNNRPDVAKALKEKVQEDLDWWREVFLLGVGRANFSGLSPAVHMLYRLTPSAHNSVSTDLEYRLAVLAAQAALELRLPQSAQTDDDGFYTELLIRLRGWLTHLVEHGKLPTIERLRAANTLSALGDPRFDDTRWHLPRLHNEKPETLLGFVHIPAGEFTMGSAEDDKDAYDDEKPAHPVTLPEFYMARYPVTNAQFNHFWQDKGYDTQRYWTPEGWAWRNGAEPDFSPIEEWENKESLENYKKWVLHRKDHTQPYRYQDSSWHESNRPVVFVTWYESLAYCNWLDEKLKTWAQEALQNRLLDNDPTALKFAKGLAENRLSVRLPTEAEWEKAARGPKSLRWPWANEWQEDCANTEEAKIEHTNPVGIFSQGRSPYGLLDMAGNTWEWTRSRWGMDVYKPDYKYPYNNEAERNELSGAHARILRGGSWPDDHGNARCAFRLRDFPDDFDFIIGFRCSVSLVISPS